MVFAIPFPPLSPEIFTIALGGFEFALRWYALAYIVGIFIGWQIIASAIARPKLWPLDTSPLTRPQLEDLATWMILGIILGGRLGFVLFYQPAYYLANPVEILFVWQGGMSFHGGFLGVVASGLIFCRRNGVPVAQLADALAMAAPPGLMLGRLANFINAELWGRPTDMPWGVIFPGTRAQDCPGIEGLCARHPSQLYEAGLEGLLVGILVLVLGFSRGWLKTPGAICGVFLAGYGISRFIVEMYRVADAQFISPDNPMGYVVQIGSAGLSMGQILSLPMILIGFAFILIARRKGRAN